MTAHGGTPPASFIALQGASLATARWDTLADALRRLRDLETDAQPWHAYYGEEDLPAAPSKQEAAIDLATQEAVDARMALIGGSTA